MAKTIYDYWFLQFEFPNKEGKPYKSSGGKMVWNEKLKRKIPEGWTCKKISELSHVITGKEDANFADKNGKYAFFTCSDNILKCNKYAFTGKMILITGNGNFNIKYYEGKCNAYQRTYVLQPDEKYIGILYQCILKQIKYFTNGSNGSIIKFIKKGDIENISVLIPNIDLFFRFNNIMSTIQNNRNENQELTSLRDFLLPLLMNGQVGFKEDKISN